MSNSWFQFQQFKVYQDRCAMKVSTDAVLLGAIAVKKGAKQILDIGTGTGVISLMLAQRFPSAQVMAVELDEDAVGQARENFSTSRFAKQLSLYEGRIQDFKLEDKCDLIVSNPPYFTDHLQSSNKKRTRALHTVELSLVELAHSVNRLLGEEGAFWVILPPEQMNTFKSSSEAVHLYPNQTFTIQDKAGKRIQREITCFSRDQIEESYSKILIKDEDGSPHESYPNLMKGFLLNF